MTIEASELSPKLDFNIDARIAVAEATNHSVRLKYPIPLSCHVSLGLLTTSQDGKLLPSARLLQSKGLRLRELRNIMQFVIGDGDSFKAISLDSTGEEKKARFDILEAKFRKQMGHNFKPFLDSNLESIILKSEQFAKEDGSSIVNDLHLLMAVIEDDEIFARILKNRGINLPEFTQEIKLNIKNPYLLDQLPKLEDVYVPPLPLSPEEKNERMARAHANLVIGHAELMNEPNLDSQTKIHLFRRMARHSISGLMRLLNPQESKGEIETLKVLE